MKKTIIAFLVLSVIVYAIYRAWKLNTEPAQTNDKTASQTIVYSSSSPSSVAPSVLGTPILATYSPGTIGNSVNDEADIVMTGLLLANHYDFEITTDLTPFPGVEMEVKKVGNNLARISIKNTTVNSVTLPMLTISALKLN